MKQKRTDAQRDAFDRRLKSHEWDAAILAGVETRRKERRSTRFKIAAIISAIAISAFSATALLVEEQNAQAQMVTMLEQFTSSNFAGQLFE